MKKIKNKKTQSRLIGTYWKIKPKLDSSHLLQSLVNNPKWLAVSFL